MSGQGLFVKPKPFSIYNRIGNPLQFERAHNHYNWRGQETPLGLTIEPQHYCWNIDDDPRALQYQSRTQAVHLNDGRYTCVLRSAL